MSIQEYEGRKVGGLRTGGGRVGGWEGRTEGHAVGIGRQRQIPQVPTISAPEELVRSSVSCVILREGKVIMVCMKEGSLLFRQSNPERQR